MQSFDWVRELRNRKKQNTAISISTSESNSSESDHIMSAPEGNANDKLETRILTQQEVDERIKSYVTPWLNS